MWDLDGNPEDLFSHNEAHLHSTVDSKSDCETHCLVMKISKAILLLQLIQAGFFQQRGKKGHLVLEARPGTVEPRHVKTNVLHMRKQRRRSASR